MARLIVWGAVGLVALLVTNALRVNWLWASLPLAIMAVGLLCARRGLPLETARRIQRALLSEKRCAGCGYDLSGATAESDGCVVCAECGAAWRLPRLPCFECGFDLADEPAVKTSEPIVQCPDCLQTFRRSIDPLALTRVTRFHPMPGEKRDARRKGALDGR
jgi:hypothetical protein